MGVISQPDVILGNEQFKAEFTKPGKEIGISLFDFVMAVSEPKKSDHLQSTK